MILSKEELFKALDDGRLVIEPQPSPRYAKVDTPYDASPFSTHAVDLRLGTEITIPQTGTFAYDLTQNAPLAPFIQRNSRRLSMDKRDHFILERHQFVLAQTLEDVRLPIDHPINKKTGTCLAARIEGKSSRARIGMLIHFTAPTVHPGWKGQLTLEIINLGPANIVLKPEMPIAQLIVEEVRGVPTQVKPSQFQNQTSPEGNPTT